MAKDFGFYFRVGEPHAVTDFRYLATCPVGVGSLLAVELKQLGASDIRETPAGVECEGALSFAYRACLWSRLANRLLVRISESVVDSTDTVYRAVKAVDWPSHFTSKSGFAVEFRGQTSYIKNTHFGALKIKDGIVDRFREDGLLRPSVSKSNPDIRIVAQLSKGRLTLSIDLSGESLHRRGYRLDGGKAPLKENVAAAVLYRCGWSDTVSNGGVLIDPMCGSGTLLIEAALIALDRAPSLERKYFGFFGWSQHNEAQWRAILADARSRALTQLPEGVEIRGYDGDLSAIKRAEENASRLDLNQVVRVRRKPLADVVKPSHRPIANGLIVTNPPWGERLGTKESATQLYRALGEKLHDCFQGWSVGVVASEPTHARNIGLRSHKQYALKSGPLDIAVYLFELDQSNRLSDRVAAQADLSESNVGKPLSDGAQMVANRLKKNHKRLSAWLRDEQVSCYRLYDADMPEYAAAIDIYGDEVQVAEYAAPKSVDTDLAERRFEEVISAVARYCDKSPDKIAVKQRKRQRGLSQYERIGQTREKLVVVEHGAKLLVNLHDYLDTGLFLDHRPLRQLIQKTVSGKRFLNLFSYTGVASVQAAVGGARYSTSVDLSNTYINWYRENLAVNGLSEAQHRAVREDVLTWLEGDEQIYDIILLDPPTFSNSKRSEDFDVQTDHKRLIELTMNRLDQQGVLYFSNNNRRFVLDDALTSKFNIEDITARTIPPDFARSPKIHRCWAIRHHRSN